MTVLLVCAVLLVPYAALVALTAVGARRRGNGLVLSAVAGVVFPVTWVAWYVRDGGAEAPPAYSRR